MSRQLKDLISVGKATLADFELLGISTVEELVDKQPRQLYEDLMAATKTAQDICVLDVFRAAIEQARDPHLSRDKCNWWYWSKRRDS